jgi:predicted dehydrogenase
VEATVSGSLRVGIVGCGKIADGHVEEIQKLPERATLVGVCDREPLMAEQLAVRYGIPRHFDHLDDLLAEGRPDVLHVTTPPEPHLAIARQALEAGCHLFVEKPLTPTHADTAALLAAARARGRRVTVGYTYLFDPPALAVRDLVASGAVGSVVHAESFFGYDLAGPFGSAVLADTAHWVHRLRGGVIQNNLDHVLYKAVEFMEDDAPRVTATAFVRRESRQGDERDHMLDELRCVLQGERSTAYGTFSGHARPAGHFVRLYGTRQTLHVDYVSRTVVRDPAPALPSALGRALTPFRQAGRHGGQGWRNAVRFARSDFHYFAGLQNLLRAFYGCILDGGPSPISDRDMLRTSALVESVLDQVAAGPRRAAR